MRNIRFKDSEGCEVGLDSYVNCTKRGDANDYAFVLLTEDAAHSARLHTIGLTFEQAKNLAVFIIEELAK